MKSTDSVVVGWDFSRGKDVGVSIIGGQKNGQADVINVYQGEEDEATPKINSRTKRMSGCPLSEL